MTNQENLGKFIVAVRKKKPFIFRLTREELEECRDMSPEAKLRWLEEANQFVHNCLSAKQLDRWRKLCE